MDDEAMARLREFNIRHPDQARTVEQAALEYIPKYVHNYFAGMDGVAVQPPPATMPATRASEHSTMLATSQMWVDQMYGATTRPTSSVTDLLKNPAEDASLVTDNQKKLRESEIFGRNTWMIWSAGNEGFWDWLGSHGHGFTDLLKVVDSRVRGTRFRDAGLINEPAMTQAGTPAEGEFGLWLDTPTDPAIRAWRAAYLQRAFDPKARDASSEYGEGTDPYRYGVPPPKIYGLSSGVIGLRLFPNPNFDDNARRRWDPQRYYNDKSYYEDPKLVRPFRVGMACAFCHASYHPLKPPRDITNPGWENISGTVGAQYLRIRAVFGNLLERDSFVYHLLDSQPPGTIDTSLIASDNINNPNTMNSVFEVPERVALSFKNPRETLSPAGESLPSVYTPSEFAAGDVPEEFLKGIPELPWSNGNPRRVPRILLDGSDSIGAYGALARVYLNIGTNYEQWNRLHTPLLGFTPQRPFKLDDVKAHSVYWHATRLRVGPMRDYFLRVTPAMKLLDARDPSGAAFATTGPGGASDGRADAIRIDTSKLKRGREVFARNCIVCHSSRQPERRHADMAVYAAKGEYWDHDPGKWLRDPEYVRWARAAVDDPAFWKGNYLSTDYRIPVNVVRTNSARAIATNARTGSMWEDFSSASYRKMPPVGSIEFFNPFAGTDGASQRFEPRHRPPEGVPAGGGGPGFYRVPTLVSIWATAPYLHNNSLGLFNNDPSVKGRLAAFDDGMRKLLWPARRLEGSSYNGATPERLARDRGLIWRTPCETYITLPAKDVPDLLGGRLYAVMRLQNFANGLPNAWIVSALLLVLAFLLLWLTARWRLLRYTAYLCLLLAVVGGLLIYFVRGELINFTIGPIPQGTPVSLLGNTNPEADPEKLRDTIALTIRTMAEIKSKHLQPEDAQKRLQDVVAPALMEVSKCPDFVMDEGHYFEWFKDMSDDDKECLIELLKTF